VDFGCRNELGDDGIDAGGAESIEGHNGGGTKVSMSNRHKIDRHNAKPPALKP
jgi:hypothetical protein